MESIRYLLINGFELNTLYSFLTKKFRLLRIQEKIQCFRDKKNLSIIFERYICYPVRAHNTIRLNDIT